MPDFLRPLYQSASGPAVDPLIDPQGALDRALELVNSYQQTGALPLLNEALAIFRALVGVTPPGHPGRVAVLSNLGTALQMLFERTGETDILSEAVQAARDAVSAIDPADPGRVVAVAMLGNALLRLFDRTGDTGVLTEAVQVGRNAVAASRPTTRTAVAS